MRDLKIPRRNIFGGLILVAVVILFVFAFHIKGSSGPKKFSYNNFIEKVDEENVLSVTLTDTAKISFTLKNDTNIYETDNPRNAKLKEILLTKNIEVLESNATTTLSLLQFFASLAFFVGGIYFVYRTGSKKSSKSLVSLAPLNSNEENKFNLKFSDVAGNHEAKNSVSDIVDFIKNPEKYTAYGAKMPKGLIFYGPPGTGKTLMAKAIAGEAGVPFFAVSGSDFVQMYVGVGASRVRELFKNAREAKKAVIFIDEIDAIGKRRSGSATGGNDERDQTLNALLTEMSGFSSTEGIVVIAATNRLDTLDEALLRPGRFDRHIEIGLPDITAREQIILYHGKNKPIGKSVDIKTLSKNTVYFSGAMLENLLNEAAIFAAKRNEEDKEISNEDMERAYYTIIAGSEKTDKSNIREKDRKITAYHESGHGLVAKLVSPENTVSKITIIPSTKGAGGFCINIPPDKMYYTKAEIKANIMVNFAGRAAEEIIFGTENITTGASNDIEKATSIIKDYVAKYGMSEEMGLLNINMFQTTNVYEECKKLAENIYTDTKNLILKNLSGLNEIAKTLLEKETIYENELDDIIKKI